MRRVIALGGSLLILLLAPPGSLAQEDPEGTLPPVIVTPDPPEVASEEALETADFELDPSINFPGLSDLQLGGGDGFGDQTGVLRSRGTLFDVPAAAAVRTRQEIEERQATDMFAALKNEVGVLMQATAAGQASPFVRGLTGQQVLILVDGIRLNNSIFRFGPNQYFNTIDPGLVDHIEVLRGQGSVLWGSDAIGGAINVVTRGPNVHQGQYHGDYQGAEFSQFYNTANSSPYSRMQVEGWLGQWGAFVGGSYQDVRDLDTGHAFGRQVGTNYGQYAGDLKLNYLLSESQLLTVSLQHHELEDVPRSDRFPGYPGDLNGSNTVGGARFFDPQQRDLAYLRYQALDPLPGWDALTLTASYHRQREVQTRGIPTTRFQETDVETVGMNAVATRDSEVLGKWTAGVDWYHDDVDSNFGGAASGPIIPDDAYYERLGTFVNWDFSLSERLAAVAGVRYEHINLAATPEVGGTPVFISPSYQDWVGQVGLVYELTPCVRLVSTVAEGFRAPNLDELTANNPNVLQNGMDLPSLGLIPERSLNYEVGVKTDGDRLRTQTFVYWIDLENNIVPISAGPNQFRRANQDSLIQGVEFDGEWLLSSGWSLYGDFWYTYGRNRITAAPLSRIPPAQGIAGLRWRDPDLRGYLSVYTWLVRRQHRLDPVRDIRDERIPPGGTPGYATLNMRLGWSFGACQQHRASISLENITDKDYLVHGSGVFGTGFTARLGYRWLY